MKANSFSESYTHLEINKQSGHKSIHPLATATNAQDLWHCLQSNYKSSLSNWKLGLPRNRGKQRNKCGKASCFPGKFQGE